MRNTWTRSDGGSQNRPGTQFIGKVKQFDQQVRLLPFIFSQDQAYILELGEDYFRVIEDGGYLLETVADNDINAITQASQAQMTLDSATGYANGDEIVITGVVGMTEVNGKHFLLSDQVGNTFKLKDVYGNYINSTGFTAYVSGGEADPILTIEDTGYTEDELMDIRYSQTADVLTLAHPNHKPRNITRSGAGVWSIADVELRPGANLHTNIPTLFSGSGTAGTTTVKYAVTRVNELGEESGQGLSSGVGYSRITNITQAFPAVMTLSSALSTSTDLKNGDYIMIVDTGVGANSMPEILYRYIRVKSGAGTTSMTLDIDTTDFTAWEGGDIGTLKVCSVLNTATVAPSTTDPVTLSWLGSNFSGYAKTISYNVYREKNGVFGFIGTSYSPGFVDTGIDPDISINPPTPRDVALDPDSYPSAVAYIQQRLAFANSINEPETVWLSQINVYHNFSHNNPITDADGIRFAAAGPKITPVKHIVDIGRMVLLTVSGEFVAEGVNGVITPSAVNLKQHTYYGANDMPPIPLNNSALFVQSRGSIVRDLSFDYQVDGYKSNDLTVFSKHLFKNRTLRDWTYHQVPHSIIWAVRDDGDVVALTYVREQEIFAWHRHDFHHGTVENVCCIPEGDEDALYMVVKRTIDGQENRYVERLYTRIVDDIVDSVFLDSAATFDGRNTNVSHTMTLSGGTNWTADETLTLTSSTAFFTSADVGNEIHLKIIDTDPDSETFGEVTDIVRCSIKTYTSPTVVSVKPHKTVPVALRTTATANWSRAVDVISGLDHLEGENVSVFADGFVVASVFNEKYSDIIVTDGEVTLPRCYATVHVGLPITSDLETLDIDTANGETISDKQKMSGSLTVFLEDTRGGFCGPSNPDENTRNAGNNPLYGLVEFKPRFLENYDEPAELKNGKFELNLLPEWNSNGRVFIRQVDPLPMSVLAVVPTGMYPFR